MPKKKVTKKVVNTKATRAKTVTATTPQRQQVLLMGVFAVLVLLGMYLFQQAMGRSLFDGADASAARCNDLSDAKCVGIKLGKRVTVEGGPGAVCVQKNDNDEGTDVGTNVYYDCKQKVLQYGSTPEAISTYKFCNNTGPCANKPLNSILAQPKAPVYANCYKATEVDPGGTGATSQAKKASVRCVLGERYTNPDEVPAPPAGSNANKGNGTGGAPKDFCNKDSDDYDKNKCKKQGGDTGESGKKQDSGDVCDPDSTKCNASKCKKQGGSTGGKKDNEFCNK